MVKNQNDKRAFNDLQNTTQKTKYWTTRTPLKIVSDLMSSGMVAVPAPLLPPILLLLLQFGDQSWTGLRQTEHIRRHLWLRYSVKINQVIVATVKPSKWWLQLYHLELFVQQFPCYQQLSSEEMYTVLVWGWWNSGNTIG